MGKPEIYIGETELFDFETALFDSGQRTVERYGDFQEIGTWGAVTQNEDGEWEKLEDTGGKMLAETVKFRSRDGKMHIGTDWIAEGL